MHLGEYKRQIRRATDRNKDKRALEVPKNNFSEFFKRYNDQFGGRESKTAKESFQFARRRWILHIISKLQSYATVQTIFVFYNLHTNGILKYT